MHSFNFFKILLLLGTAQGLITTILLFILKPKIYANKILAFIILFISLACLNFYFYETITNFTRLLQVLSAVLPLIIIMPLGPLSYFYVKAILNPEFRLSRIHRPHFYSTFIDLLPYLVSTLILSLYYLELIEPALRQRWLGYIDLYFMYSDIPRWLSLSIYLWFAHQLLHDFVATKNEFLSLDWARRFTYGMSIFAGLWLLHLIPYIIPSLSDQLLSTFGWFPVYTPLVILIYWLGINGLIISLRSNSNPQKKLENKTVAEVKTALERAMTKDQLYLNPALKLSDVVNHINVPQKIISTVLNQHLDSSFNEFINSYRIEAVKSRLVSNASKELTITGLAYECGFNSQATFQRVFKKATNCTPKEFQQNLSLNTKIDSQN